MESRAVGSTAHSTPMAEIVGWITVREHLPRQLKSCMVMSRFIRSTPLPIGYNSPVKKTTCFSKIVLDKWACAVYTDEADSAVPIISLATHGGVTQLVEYPVHTRLVTCSSQVAATRPVGQAVKTPPFHGGNMGSIPVRVTMRKRGRPEGRPLFYCTKKLICPQQPEKL